ncbi:MAG TPA: hypothetical protein PKD88_03320 [Nitrosomonas sp.]|nr:hypothetical protein [Nitrosomonas sp.]HMW20021.1 hypothetical protein [Nitrosomonas sp.]HMY62461.1 hypothetical protein [Nitrosomonas sp.]HMY90722.1 hypothetical protein [Nitrosomonas sp.]HNA71245.1 hypothetical protein [Nitrosomonas sp.]
MKKRVWVIILILIGLTGCSTIYFLEGKEYEGRRQYIAARAEMYQRCIEGTISLNPPPIQRKLIALIPSQEAIFRTHFDNIKESNPNFPVTMEDLRQDPIYFGMNENYRLVVELIKKRNLYQDLQIEEYETLTVPEVDEESDVFYIALPKDTKHRDMYYLNTEKRGKLRVDYGPMDPDCETARAPFLALIPCEQFRDQLLTAIEILAKQSP